MFYLLSGGAVVFYQVTAVVARAGELRVRIARLRPIPISTNKPHFSVPQLFVPLSILPINRTVVLAPGLKFDAGRCV